MRPVLEASLLSAQPVSAPRDERLVALPQFLDVAALTGMQLRRSASIPLRIVFWQFLAPLPCSPLPVVLCPRLTTPIVARVRADAATFFPRDVPTLSAIAVDFGRAHYFTYANSADIARHVHTNVYANVGTATEDERRAFFAALGLNADAALKAASEVQASISYVGLRLLFCADSASRADFAEAECARDACEV